MVQLTATELKVLNELSQVQDYDVRLGTIISTIIGSTAEEGTPTVPITRADVRETVSV